MCELWLQYCLFGESSVSALVPAGLSSRGGVLYLRGETHIIFLLPTALKLADPSQLVHALGWVVAPCTWIKRTFLVLYHLTKQYETYARRMQYYSFDIRYETLAICIYVCTGHYAMAHSTRSGKSSVHYIICVLNKNYFSLY